MSSGLFCFPYFIFLLIRGQIKGVILQLALEMVLITDLSMSDEIILCQNQRGCSLSPNYACLEEKMINEHNNNDDDE